jgi:hypothetical protein
MEFVALDLHLGKFWIRDLDAGRVGFRIQFSMNLQTGCGRRRGDEADNRFETSQGFPRQFWTGCGVLVIAEGAKGMAGGGCAGLLPGLGGPSRKGRKQSSRHIRSRPRSLLVR